MEGAAAGLPKGYTGSGIGISPEKQGDLQGGQLGSRFLVPKVQFLLDPVLRLSGPDCFLSLLARRVGECPAAATPTSQRYSREICERSALASSGT